MRASGVTCDSHAYAAALTAGLLLRGREVHALCAKLGLDSTAYKKIFSSWRGRKRRSSILGATRGAPPCSVLYKVSLTVLQMLAKQQVKRRGI
ncbi:hypothetical protein PR202_ga14150 [Eleusine coracana subsp. coracana]|uniref:Uncharacterized protein n=1 Tax=Eleusine coracana subsp. coracana TaxID=191504 RepID=A0AAV5CGR9_ELECO|nr:hypothetical protein PR202_ga14150 [Eleusine coracana subsp. coracana]